MLVTAVQVQSPLEEDLHGGVQQKHATPLFKRAPWQDTDISRVQTFVNLPLHP
jgi:hypothetical protein